MFRQFDTREPWWSVPPPGYEKLLSRPAEIQVVEQIRMIHGQLEQDIARLSLGPTLMRVDYEDIPKKVQQNSIQTLVAEFHGKMINGSE